MRPGAGADRRVSELRGASKQMIRQTPLSPSPSLTDPLPSLTPASSASPGLTSQFQPHAWKWAPISTSGEQTDQLGLSGNHLPPRPITGRSTDVTGRKQLPTRLAARGALGFLPNQNSCAQAGRQQGRGRPFQAIHIPSLSWM